MDKLWRLPNRPDFPPYSAPPRFSITDGRLTLHGAKTDGWTLVNPLSLVFWLFFRLVLTSIWPWVSLGDRFLLYSLSKKKKTSALQSLIKIFFHRAAHIDPTIFNLLCQLRISTWCSLYFSPPPIWTISLEVLTCKVAFLVAIASTEGFSELAALFLFCTRTMWFWSQNLYFYPKWSLLFSSMRTLFLLGDVSCSIKKIGNFDLPLNFSSWSTQAPPISILWLLLFAC